MIVAFVVFAALITAFLNATSAVMQRRASSKVSPQELFKGSLVVNLTRNRLWLGGLGVQVAAFLVQAGALSQGSLIIVEPLTTTDLVFLLLILQFRYKLHAGLREWGGVAGIGAGLSGILIAANPRNGHLTFEAYKWAIVSSVIAIIALVAALTVRRSRSALSRAAIAGVAAGASFGLTSAFTKLAVSQLHYGFVHFLASWEVYALIVSGMISIILMQSAYSAGPLAAAQPAVEIMEPAVSAVIGITLFGDIVNHSPEALVIELACSVLLIFGVIMLTGSKDIQNAGKKGV